MKLPHVRRSTGLILLLILVTAGATRAQGPLLSAPAALFTAARTGHIEAEAPDQGRTWSVETVDAPKLFDDMGPRSLALDGNRHPHIAYGSDHLYYAYYDGSAWNLSTVDSSPGVGRHASLALSASGQPAISYYDSPNGDLRYARRQCVGYICLWSLDTVDSTGRVGEYTSLALDTAGWPHISYYDDTNADLKYAYQDASGWHVQTVAGSGATGQYTSLALDAAGHPHIAYHDLTNGDLMYAWHNGSNWLFYTADATAGDVGEYPSLVLDGAGFPHISYYDRSNSDLKYAYMDGSGWHAQTVAGTGVVGLYTSLALNSAGRPYITYYDSTDGDLEFAWFNGLDWGFHTLDSAGDTGQYTSLALDHLDAGYASYCDEAGTLYYISFDPGNWWGIGVTVDTSAYLTHASLALSPGGQPRISYYDSNRGDLRYASLLTWPVRFWLLQTIDSDGYVGEYSSLAVDSTGNPHISYYDGANGALRYATYVGSGGNCGPTSSWQCTTVDDSGNVGWYTSLALDSLGHPHISYHSSTAGSLAYVYSNGSTWFYQTVDDGGTANVGRYSSLVLDASGVPHISYYDSTNDALKYAYYVGAGGNCGTSSWWHCQTVDYSGDTGWYTSLALDSAGRPHIAYYDFSDYDLEYAWYDGSTWHLQTVDSDGQVGAYPALVLDGSDRPRISYQDSTERVVKYAWHDGTSWHSEIVDGSGWTGGKSSLALDASGRPHVSYQDIANADLKYARPAPYEVYLPAVHRGW